MHDVSECAKAQDICQACGQDRNQGVSVQVRDSILQALGTPQEVDPQAPKTTVNLDYIRQLAGVQVCFNYCSTIIIPIFYF